MLEEYKQWKKDNQGFDYQNERIKEFVNSFTESDIQYFLKDVEELEAKAKKWDALKKKCEKAFKGERDLYALESIIETAFKL